MWSCVDGLVFWVWRYVDGSVFSDFSQVQLRTRTFNITAVRNSNLAMCFLFSSVPLRFYLIKKVFFILLKGDLHSVKLLRSGIGSSQYFYPVKEISGRKSNLHTRIQAPRISFYDCSIPRIESDRWYPSMHVQSYTHTHTHSHEASVGTSPAKELILEEYSVL